MAVHLSCPTMVGDWTGSGMRRGWFWAGFFALALLLAACGGGDAEQTMFASDDGVVSVEVPPGAAPDGFSGTVSKSDLPALGVDISDVESVFLVYDLGPDDTEFDEPVTVTFRVSAALGGFDPNLGLPLSLVVIEDGAGGFEPLGSMTSFLDGDVLVVEGTTTHFSKAAMEIGRGSIRLGLEPFGKTKKVGSQFEALVFEQNDTGSIRLGRVDFSFEGSISEVSIQAAVATVLCAEKGEGLVEARVFGGDENNPWDLLVFANLFTGGSAEYLGKLSYDVECVEDLAGTSSTTSTTLPPEQDASEDPNDEDGETEPDPSLLDSVPGSASGQVDFRTHENSPPGASYTAEFDIEIDAETGRIKKTQKPSDQMTEGPIDPVSLTYFTTGGDGYFEVYVGVVCPLPDGSYFIGGYTFGGEESMAETFQSLMDSIPGLDVSLDPPQSISVDPALAPNCDEFISNPSELGDWMRNNLGPSGPIPRADWDVVFADGFQP